MALARKTPLIAFAALFLAGAGAPEEKPLPRLCVCAEPATDDSVAFTGIVTDAELLLNESGHGVLPRQAAVFRIVQSKQLDQRSATKVWHTTDLKRCGVVFDYGRQYNVRAKRTADGLETNYCLMKDVAQPAP
ncbi:MAG: hypothetical protein AB7P23_04535 [Amphiplicatus sp.]